MTSATPLGSFSVGACSEASPPSSCRLWLPLDTLYGLRCQAGAIKMITVAGSDGQQMALQSTFNQSAGMCTVDTNVLGEFAVLAELWPSQKLRGGVAGVSPALGAALGGSLSPGFRIQIHNVPPELDPIQPCSSIQLQLYPTNQEGGGGASSAALVHHRRSWEGSAAAVDEQQQQQPPSTPNPISPAQQRGRAAAPPQIPRPSPPSARASVNSLPVTPNLLGSSSRRTNKKTPASEDGRSVSSTIAVQRADLGKSGMQLVAAQDLLKAGQLDSKVCDILQVLAAQVLSERRVLVGNMINLPFLGLDVFLKVEKCEGASEDHHASIIGGQVVASTTIEILAFGGDASTSKSLSFSGTTSYAKQAAQAAAEALGESDASPAATAAFHAANAGLKSRGAPLSALGGLQSQMKILQQAVMAPLRDHHKFAARGLSPPSGVLFHGPPGTGKTALARATANDANAAFFVINGPDIVSEYLGESEACLKGIFAAARALAPAVIFIDEVDAIAPNRGGPSSKANNHSPVSARLVTTLLAELDAIKGQAVVVLAATNRLEALDDSLRRPGRLEKEIEIGVPSAPDRLDILRKMLMNVQHMLRDDDIISLAEDAHGFVGADLSALCSEAAMTALRRLISSGGDANCVVTAEDFNYSKSIVRPSALREVILETPKVKWSDIGGNDDIKQQLKEVVQWPRLFQNSLSRMGAMPPRGVLLYGPPGCSKTLLAKAVAREANMNFLAIKGPELFNKYVGESEKALRNVFEKARASSPSILFFDEIDGMIGSRDDGGNAGGVNVSERVLSQLLQEMDGLQGGSCELIVLAATNRPDCLDSALLRPGRFDRLLFLPPPDQSARRAIFEIHTRTMPLNTDVDLDHLASVSHSFTGADIAAVCQQAAFIALEHDETATLIGMSHIMEAMQRIVPSVVDGGTVEMYESFRRKVV